MDPPDESPPEDRNPEQSAEQPPTWGPPRIPPRYFGPIGPPPRYGLHPHMPPLPGGSLATLALVFSIIGSLGLLGCCWGWVLSAPMSLAGLVLAIVARQKNKETPETPGNSQATAALIISGIVLGLPVLALLVAWVIFAIDAWRGF